MIVLHCQRSREREWKRELWQLWTVDWLIKPAAFVIHTDVQMEPQADGAGTQQEARKMRQHRRGGGNWSSSRSWSSGSHSTDRISAASERIKINSEIATASACLTPAAAVAAAAEAAGATLASGNFFPSVVAVVHLPSSFSFYSLFSAWHPPGYVCFKSFVAGSGNPSTRVYLQLSLLVADSIYVALTFAVDCVLHSHFNAPNATWLSP